MAEQNEPNPKRTQYGTGSQGTSEREQQITGSQGVLNRQGQNVNQGSTTGPKGGPGVGRPNQVAPQGQEGKIGQQKTKLQDLATEPEDADPE
jgi:hypothetical protein